MSKQIENGLVASDLERERVLALLRRFGWNATSFQVLEPGLRYRFLGPDACVAYVDTGAAWVAAGAPICAGERLGEVVRAFLTEAEKAGRRACFFSAESRMVDLPSLKSMHIGEQPVWAPAQWETTLRKSRSLREQLRRAKAKGVSVRAVPVSELGQGSPTREATEVLMHRWLGTRAMPPMGFLVQLFPFDFPEERRYFAAEHEGQLVGMLIAVPVYARDGWLFEDLLRDPRAPNGTVELLVDVAMKTVADEGSRFVTMGMAPLSGEVAGWLRAIRRWGSDLYDFEGGKSFKGKLRPQSWDALYLSVPKHQGGVRSLVDVLAAFARGGLLSFGLETLLRGPAIVLRLLTLLLVPWTLLLALAPVAPWFPAPAVKWTWVAFDVGLAAGLYSLLQRWRRALAATLAVLVTADAILTSVQVAAFNGPRLHGPFEVTTATLSIIAPTVAAFMLWRAWTHRSDFV